MPSNEYDTEATELLETYGQYFLYGDILSLTGAADLQTF